MVLLNAKDKQILHDGINKQFNFWQKSNPNPNTNITKHKLLDLVNKKTFLDFRELDGMIQWDFLCSLYCLYQSDTAKKSKFYNNSDIAKVNKKLTGHSIKTTIQNVNLAFWDIGNIK